MKKYMPEAGIEPGTFRTTVHCPSRRHEVGTSILMKKMNVYYCKGDKSISPHADQDFF